MARATEDKVKTILNTDLDDISFFIAVASDFVEDRLKNKGISEKILEKIEIFLTAHFISIKEPQVKEEKYGEATNIYRGTSSFGINSSTYGQTAINLDSSGTLNNIAKGFKLSGDIKVY